MQPTIQTENYTLYHADCLDVLPTLAAGSVDAVVTDPPYGTTACTWDSVIPFDPMWAGIKHVVRQRAAVVLFGSQPFTSALVMSNVDWFKYEWVWDKKTGRGHLIAKFRPMAQHENILVFGSGAVNYFPQLQKRHPKEYERSAVYSGTNIIPTATNGYKRFGTLTHRNPKTILTHQNATIDRQHPTQKPVPLIEYLVKTYTNPSGTVLDFTMGSGTTGVACANLGRKFIGIELDKTYFDIAAARIANAYGDLTPTPAEKASPQMSLLEALA